MLPKYIEDFSNVNMKSVFFFIHIILKNGKILVRYWVRK